MNDASAFEQLDGNNITKPRANNAAAIPLNFSSLTDTASDTLIVCPGLSSRHTPSHPFALPNRSTGTLAGPKSEPLMFLG
jgi:hypothetical protein